MENQTASRLMLATTHGLMRTKPCVLAVLSGLLIAIVPSALAQTEGSADAAPEVRYIEPQPEAGSSMATVAGNVPLAHTEQLLPHDAQGQLVGKGDPGEQVARVLENLRLALEPAGAGLGDALKINVYAARQDVVEHVRDRFAQTFTGEAKPAVSFVVTSLPGEALVAMDAVAVAASTEAHRERAVYHAEALGEDAQRGHVAVMPPGGKVYVSGQVAQGAPVGAMRESLESMHDRLAYLGLSADDVVQVKVFLDDIADADTLSAKIAAYYRRKPSPPVVMVEWTHPSSNVEVELIAARGPEEEAPRTEAPRTEAAVTYPLPPGLDTFPTYSRVAEIHGSGVVYVSGLYGDPSKEAAGQMRDIFTRLGDIIRKAGTDFDHLAKATYYLKGWDVKGPLWGIRKEFYDPQRPPTSSLIPVEGVGREGALVTIDMIGAVPQ